MNSDRIQKPLEDISKALEIINFNTLWRNISQEMEQPEVVTSVSHISRRPKRWNIKKNKISQESKPYKSQIAAFQGAMKLLFLVGRSLGLNPVVGISDTDFRNIRFSTLNWRFIHSILTWLILTITTILCIIRLLTGNMNFQSAGFIGYFMTACVTSSMFMKVGKNWNKLVKSLSDCSLNEYIDPQIKCKCTIVTAIIFTISTVEHIYGVVNAYLEGNKSTDQLLRERFPWLFDFNIVQPNLPLAILLEYLNFVTPMNWNYLTMYVICMGLYLTSILNKINDKISDYTEKRNLTSSHWRSLREDYTRAIQLVRSVDEIFSGIVFSSFASNMFFICFQLFQILSYFMQFRQEIDAQNIGSCVGLEHAFKLLVSMAYVLAKSLAVALVAASVHHVSLVPNKTLYKVPSTSFCCEISRFQDQVHSDSVALTGLRFFSVTKELVLSIAEAIVTYELVLLQFSSEDLGRRL